MKPPTISGETSFTTSTRTGLSKQQMHGAPTRGSSNGFRLSLIQVAWITLW